MKTHFVIVVACALMLTGCGKSDNAAQKAQEDAEWKANVAKADAERIEREKELTAAAMSEHERQQQASAAAEKAQADADAEAIELSLVDHLKQSMFDPNAAIVRNMKMSSDGRSLCGEVNGKNKFGAYIGFKKFVVYNNLPIVDDGSDSTMYMSVAPLVDCHL